MARRTIVALYDTREDADAARRALLDAGAPDLDVEIVAEGGYGAASGHGGLQPRLLGWGVPRDEADAYAADVQRGGALLVASFKSDAGMDAAADTLRRGVPYGAPADRPLGDAATAMRAANAAPPGTGPVEAPPPATARPEPRR